MSRVRSVTAAVLALGLAMALGACATALDAAQQGRGAVSRAFDESVQAWKQYDAQKQKQIASDAPTKEASHAALETYRVGEQSKMTKLINACWAALVGLDKAIALWAAGQKKDLAAALTVAYGTLSDMSQALTALGVPIPGGR